MAPTMKARHFSTFMPFAVGIFRKPSQVQGLLLLQAQVPVARAVAEPRDQDVEDIGVQTNKAPSASGIGFGNQEYSSFGVIKEDA